MRKHLNSLGFLTEKDGKLYRVLLQDPASPPEEVTLEGQLDQLDRRGIVGVMKISSKGRSCLPV
jgi:hypothetical protein